jgi:hypothetical protein
MEKNSENKANDETIKVFLRVRPTYNKVNHIGKYIICILLCRHPKRKRIRNLCSKKLNFRVYKQFQRKI